MTSLESIAAFVLAVGLLTIMPGLDTALVLRVSFVDGRRSAMLAAGGIALGSLAWGVVVALGLGVLLDASRIAYLVLRILGAAYLCFLGVGLVRSAFCSTDVAVRTVDAHPAAGGSRWLARGFATNILNPKVGVFYVSLLPQFVPPGVDVAAFSILLAAIHATMGIAWFALLTGFTTTLTGLLRRPIARRALDVVTGSVLIAFGLRLALERRPT